MHDKTLRALNQLHKNNINYEIKNDGVQLIVEGNNGLIDYYPTTGNWADRKTKHKDISLRRLIIYITEEK